VLDYTPTPGSPDWWLLRLGKKLQAEIRRFDLLDLYWRGTPPVPHGNRKMREAYRRHQKMSRTNFGLLLAETVLERMKIVGFRAGGDATDEADKDAWEWWQDNNLDADAGLVHRAAVVMSRAYVIVGRNDEGDPLITPEDPRQVIHEAAPENRRDVRAALKTWWDDVEDAQLAVLYLPEAIFYYRTVPGRSKEASTELWAAQVWQVDESEFPGGVASNDMQAVPVVPFVNRPDMSGGGLGEFEDVIDILDRINSTILDRMVISAMQAYRQRWATGVDLTDEKGQPADDFDPGADLLWNVPNPDAKFGSFEITDVTPVIKAVESDVQYLAAITRTPPSYLLAGIVNVSGNALALTETGLVSKIEEREQEFGNSWETVYKLVGDMIGTKVASDCEVIWRDPQFRSSLEMSAAAVQQMTAGVPWRTRMRGLGMTPGEVERMEAERVHDAMLSSILAPLSVAEGGLISTNRGVTYTETNVLPGAAGSASPAPSPDVVTEPASGSPAKAGPAAGQQSTKPVRKTSAKNVGPKK